MEIAVNGTNGEMKSLKSRLNYSLYDYFTGCITGTFILYVLNYLHLVL
jgi:hypothetical protein